MKDSACISPVPQPVGERKGRAAGMGRLGWGARRIAIGAWKYFFGMFLCQIAVGALIVVGWTYRLMQRSALRAWWKQSALAEEGLTFGRFAAGSHLTAVHGRWPNWIVANDGAWNRPRSKLLRRLFGSLITNLRLGLQGMFNTWVLTLPAGALWLFAWHAGWNNSFYKGYEQAAIGPLIGLLGVAWFIAAMFFPACVILRLAVVRIYASAVLGAVQSGAVGEERLAEIEWESMHRLDLLRHRPAPVRPRIVRLLAWAGTRAGRAAGAAALVFIWFTFVAQIFVSEFFNYHPGVGWLNQPLVQLPWFQYIPAALR